MYLSTHEPDGMLNIVGGFPISVQLNYRFLDQDDSNNEFQE